MNCEKDLCEKFNIFVTMGEIYDEDGKCITEDVYSFLSGVCKWFKLEE